MKNRRRTSCDPRRSRVQPSLLRAHARYEFLTSSLFAVKCTSIMCVCYIFGIRIHLVSLVSRLYVDKSFTISIFRILLHINNRWVLRTWLPVNGLVLLCLLLVYASARLSKLLRNIVQTDFRLWFHILPARSEPARDHIFDCVIGPGQGLCFLFITLSGSRHSSCGR